MQEEARLNVRRGYSSLPEASQAAMELAAGIRQPDMQIVIFFCSSRYDLKVLGEVLKKQFDCPVVGCTTAGEITSEAGYLKDGIVGVTLSSKELVAHPKL